MSSEAKIISELDEVKDIVSKNRNLSTVESQQKTCGAKSLLHPSKIEDLTGTAEAFVLNLTSQLYLSPDSPCAVANHLKLGFDGA